MDIKHSYVICVSYNANNSGKKHETIIKYVRSMIINISLGMHPYNPFQIRFQTSRITNSFLGPLILENPSTTVAKKYFLPYKHTAKTVSKMPFLG